MQALHDRELRRFAELRPRGMQLLERARQSMPNGVPTSWMATLYEHPPIVMDRGSGATFTDIDGNEYLDFNLADTSMFGGHGVEAVARVAAERVAAGSQFLLPTEDAAEVASSSPAASGCRPGSSRSRPPRRTSRPSVWPGRPPAAAWS